MNPPASETSHAAGSAPATAGNSAGRPRINPWSVWVLIAIMLGGIVVYFSYVKMVQNQDYRPGLKGKLTQNLDLVDRTGEAVSLNDLEGKVWIVGQVFTRCPGQCAGMSVQMEKLQQEFGEDPRFHLVSVSLDPAHDTPELLDGFADTHGFEGDNWWFATGDPEDVHEYMRRNFHFAAKKIEESERTNVNDLFVHAPRVALVDGAGHIRGWYDLFNAMAFEQLRTDLGIVLDEDPDARGWGGS